MLPTACKPGLFDLFYDILSLIAHSINISKSNLIKSRINWINYGDCTNVSYWQAMPLI